MNYTYLLIITKNKPNLPTNIEFSYFNNPFTLLDENHVRINDEEIEFSYLIYSSLVICNNEVSDLMFEDNHPITNYIYQTNIDSIFYLNNEESLDDKINEIITEA